MSSEYTPSAIAYQKVNDLRLELIEEIQAEIEDEKYRA